MTGIKNTLKKVNHLSQPKCNSIYIHTYKPILVLEMREREREMTNLVDY